MAENRERRQLYSEKEVGTLIQRATEIQEGARESMERGLSLQEVEHIAAEIGIDLKHLQASAMELENRLDAGETFSFWGGPFVLDQKRVVEGKVTEEQWEQIVLGLRRLTGSVGHTSPIGQIREWTRVIQDLGYVMEQTQVIVSPRKDQTTIELRVRYQGGALMTYVLGTVFSVAVAGIFLDGAGLTDPVDTAIIVSSATGGLAAARTFIAYWARRQRKKLRRLMGWLHDTIAQPTSIATEEQQFIEQREFSPEEVLQPEESKTRPIVRV
jgi:hypothetical protein